MNRRLTVLFAAFEAALVAGIGIAIPLVPLTVLWAVQFGFGVDWVAFWRASVDVWLIGHGVDVRVTLDPAIASRLGFVGADQPFAITIAALGFALVTALLAVRAGRRVAETRYPIVGELAALAAFAAVSLGATYSALHHLARPSIVQGTLLPTLVFAIGLAIGVRITRPELDDAPRPIRTWIAQWPPHIRGVVGTAFRGGAAAVASVILVASLATTVAIVVSYARIITLYESLHTEVFGGFAVTLGQAAFLPNFVIWVASWFVGPGFAIGTGSAVGPLGTALGPIPAIPILGALPAGQLSFGFVGLVVPVVAGFIVGAITHSRRGDEGGATGAATAIGMGIVGGVILGLLAWFSGGSAGPGRLQDVGPNAWAVGGWGAIEFSVGAFLGMLAASRRSSAKASTAPR